VISKFSVSNFKAFGKEQEFTIKPITLVFGANSSGKSSFLHSFLYLHHLWATGEVDAWFTKLGGTSVDLGGLKQFSHRGVNQSNLSFSLFLNNTSSEKLEINIRHDHKSVKISRRSKSKSYVEFDTFPNYRTTIDRFGEIHPSLKTLSENIEELYQPYDVEPNINVRELLNLFAYVAFFPGLFSQIQSVSSERMIGNFESGSDYSLVKITAPMVSRQCRDVTNALWDLSSKDMGEFADRIYFFINRDIGDYEREWWEEVEREWIKAGYQKQFGSIDDNAGLIEEAYYKVFELFPFFEKVKQKVLALLEPLQEGLSKLTYLGPLRSYPSRQSLSEGNNNSIDWLASGDFAWSKLRNDADLRNKVNEWLGNEKLGSGLKLETRDLYSGDEMTEIIEKARSKRRLSIEELLKQVNPLGRELVLKDLRAHTTVGLRDVGIGVAQVLPVLVRALGSLNQTHLIEQPELHLHPALQSELADVFIRSANSSNNSSPANTFILETHSEHLILRILRRIRETNEGRVPEGLELKASDVSVIYVENTPDGSQVHHIAIAEDGTFAQPWPKGFFAERLEELL
jgi:predicted ATPase